MAITVSVVMPTYNRRALIGAAIESVLKQSFTDLEIVIVDDGSTDGTEKFIKENYTDERIKYTWQKNCGQGAARNRAVALAKGEYIGFLDSDDYWPADKLEVSMVAFGEDIDVDVVYGDEMIVDGQGNEIGIDKLRRYSGYVTEKLLIENFVGMSASMVKKDKYLAVGGINESLKIAEDYSLWLNLSRKSKFRYIDTVLGYYRLSDNQISLDKSAWLDCNLEVINEFLEKYPDSVADEKKKSLLCSFHAKRVRVLAGEKRYMQALREFLVAVKFRPISSLPWRSLYRVFFPQRDT